MAFISVLLITLIIIVSLLILSFIIYAIDVAIENKCAIKEYEQEVRQKIEEDKPIDINQIINEIERDERLK